MLIDNQYHCGFVVADLDAAMAELTASIGARWRAQVDRAIPMWTPGGVLNVHLRRVYSVEGPPYIELLEPVDAQGLIWDVPSPGHVHHLGFWSEDVAADAAVLERAGAVKVIEDVNLEGGPLRYAYHRMPSGVYLELVASSLQGMIGLPG